LSNYLSYECEELKIFSRSDWIEIKVTEKWFIASRFQVAISSGVSIISAGVPMCECYYSFRHCGVESHSLIVLWSISRSRYK